MREFSKEGQMDNKCVQEITPLAMKEMQIKLQGGPGAGSVAQLVWCLSCKYVEKISILRTHL